MHACCSWGPLALGLGLACARCRNIIPTFENRFLVCSNIGPSAARDRHLRMRMLAHLYTQQFYTHYVQVLFLEMMRPDTPTDAAPRSSSPAHAHAGQQHAGVGYNQVACMRSCKEASLDTRIDHRHSYRQIFTHTRMQDEIHAERGRQTMVYASFTGVALTIPT